ncbi:hypothetical protein QUB75_19615 [Microcoleus sp. K1-B6]|uniref:hypothetical protein n=1 Tax=unclassified Microcoleus TaxID=2642155 RepID=UPI002FCFC8E2
MCAVNSPPNLAQTWRSAFDRTFLSPRTIAKIVGREVGFDRRTLKQITNYQLPITNYQLPTCVISVLGLPT